MNPNESKNTRILWSWGAGSSEAACSLRRWRRRLSEPLQKLFKVSTQEIHTKETSIFKKKTTRELPTVQELKKEQAAVQTAAGALHS